MPTSQKQESGKENLAEAGTRWGGQTLCCPPPAGKQFCNPDLSLSPAWLRFSHYQEQDVGGDFRMVGAPAPSPGRYKANSPDQRNLEGKQREATMSSWSPERNQR